MLARRFSLVKPKLFLFLFPPLALTLGLLLYFRTPPLISPFLNATKPPDLTEKLSQKLTSPPFLDYSASTSISDLPAEISYLLYNPLTGTVFAAKNETQKISPASFTKLITSIVALDLASPDQLLSATETSVNKEPTILGLKTTEQLTLSELLRATLTTSANDAAATIAEGIANIYGQNSNFFVTQMNKKAQLMNMKDTHFANPEGYDDDNQYSTLEDLVILVNNVTQNYPEIIAAASSDRDDLLATSTHGFYYLINWNTLLNLYPGVTGLKIAYTKNAGYSTIITANRKNIPVVLILSGAKTLKERDLYSAQLLDHAYASENLPPVNLTQEDLQTRYDIWNELIRQIRKELDAQKELN